VGDEPVTSWALKTPSSNRGANNRLKRLYRSGRKMFSDAKPFVEVAAPLILAWFAFSTDRVYHKLEAIELRQVEIAASQNLPIFVGSVSLIKSDDTQRYDVDSLEISNAGAPISVVSVDTQDIIVVDVLEGTAPLKEIEIPIPTNAFYPAASLQNVSVGTVYRTFQSRNRGLVYDWNDQLIQHGYKGQEAHLDILHYVSIVYLTREHDKQYTTYLSVNEFGASDIPEAKWIEAKEHFNVAMENGYLIDFNHRLQLDDLTNSLNRALLTKP
jgi:hypothetical protein